MKARLGLRMSSKNKRKNIQHNSDLRFLNKRKTGRKVRLKQNTMKFSNKKRKKYLF